MFSTFTYKYLSFRRPTRPPHPLPAGIERHYIKTPGGNIEVLHAAPASPSRGDDVTPLCFVHGGMGGAWVWTEYMQYFSARGIPCYAVSMRGHGDSWYPSFLRMCYFTTKRMLADDIVAGVRWAQARESGKEVVLVAHSSGGGLSQFILSKQELRVKGLVLAGAVPGFGSLGVYTNWFIADPWFSFRMIFHGWHPNSPLSHPALTRRIFFSNKLPDAYVDAFQARTSPYESFLWPLGMGYPFVDPQRVLGQISSWGRARQGLMVLYGEVDVIMDRTQMEKLGRFYRSAFSALVGKKKIESEDKEVKSLADGGEQDSVGHGVRIGVVPGAGHHLQNDVTWEVGAEKLLEFYDQL